MKLDTTHINQMQFNYYLQKMEGPGKKKYRAFTTFGSYFTNDQKSNEKKIILLTTYG